MPVKVRNPVKEINKYTAHDKMFSNIQNSSYTNYFSYGSNDKEGRDKYNDEQARIKLLFQEDLKANYGFEGHDYEGFKKVFEMAWEQGHASGYYDVAQYFDDFYDVYLLGVKAGRTGLS
jgi:hypothetical protein